MPGTVLSMQNIYLVKKNYANPLEGDTKPPEDSASMKFVYHQLNSLNIILFTNHCSVCLSFLSIQENACRLIQQMSLEYFGRLAGKEFSCRVASLTRALSKKSK